jgi:hypothetical protein
MKQNDSGLQAEALPAWRVVRNATSEIRLGDARRPNKLEQGSRYLEHRLWRHVRGA